MTRTSGVQSYTLIKGTILRETAMAIHFEVETAEGSEKHWFPKSHSTVKKVGTVSGGDELEVADWLIDRKGIQV